MALELAPVSFWFFIGSVDGRHFYRLPFVIFVEVGNDFGGLSTFNDARKQSNLVLVVLFQSLTVALSGCLVSNRFA